ncbi:MAG: hypothetical protein D6776_02320, partial [Planctomycetota bacterium]
AISGPLHGWLLFLGVLGLVVELLHPGLVLPGVLGAACLGLALFGSHVLGLLDTLDVALLVLGAALLLLEVFVIPGFGAAGVAGLVAFALGVLLSLQPFVLPDPNDPAQKALLLRHLRGLAFGGIGLLAALALLVRVLPRSPWLHRLVLTGAQRPEDGYTVAAPDRVALIGRRGRARTALRPAGKVEIAGEPVDAVTEGDWIEAGAEIEVIGTDANRVLVRSTHRRGGENVA